MVWLAAMHRAVAEGQQLSPAEQELHRRRVGEPPSIAALRYAELLVDAEVRIAQLTGSSAEELVATREELALRREEAVNTFRAACHARNQPALDGSPEDPVATRVIREVAPHTFEKAFRHALKRRGSPVEALEPPAANLWSWLQTQSKRPSALPEEVKRLSKLDLADFIREAVAEISRWECDQSMAHPAVAEQWAACTKEIVTELAQARRSLEADLSGGTGKGIVARLRRAGEAYARGNARCLEAQLIVADLRAQANQLHWSLRVPKARADAAAEAATAVRQADSARARQVDRALEEHRKSCRERNPRQNHSSCSSSIARLVRKRLEPVDLPGSTQPEAQEPAVDNAAPSKPPQDEPEAAAFLCPEMLKQMPTDMACVVGVVEVAYSDAGRFGFAWVTEHGELSTGADRAVNDHDAWLRAICRAVLDLGAELSNVQIVCRDERAASVTDWVVHHKLVPEALGFPVSDRTRDLLHSLITRPGKIFVSVDVCPKLHKGSASAKRLASVALGAGSDAGGAQRVKTLADRISEELRDLAESRAAMLPEQIGFSQWLSGGGDARELRWRTAVSRGQLNGNWCALPDGSRMPPTNGERTRLVVRHPGQQARTGQTEGDVLIRQVGERWELHGVVWPAEVLPGTVITFRWRPSEGLITATTDLLARPEQVDELTYRHRYDIRTIVRDNAPGADDGPVPDLSDSGWVLRTLRKLGHLSPDGSAVLAERALVRNCLELGLPRARVERIPPAVARLIEDRRVTRVRGGLDSEGLPSYPARTGQTPVDLLRYAPRVVPVGPPADQRKAKQAPRTDHWVDGFVRRLPAGAQASAESVEAHREAVRAAQVVDRALPDGFTYVRRHRRAR
ncbi:hypothetical protein [Micromonospora zamorensis]|uniref:Uncharacterized protein n=1 Tax=Micromonospora zamorensis TaxID=709883 RepID=A0ABZ1PJU2_9ACTN